MLQPVQYLNLSMRYLLETSKEMNAEFRESLQVKAKTIHNKDRVRNKKEDEDN